MLRLAKRVLNCSSKVKLTSQIHIRLFSIFEGEAKLDENKKYFVTTPIYYVNAAPHLGHYYSTLLADSQLRFQKLLGKTDSLLSTGCDEHGLKVAQTALINDTTPQKLCDANSQLFKDLSKKIGVDMETLKFIRTTDPMHKETVQSIWNRLESEGYIEKSSYSGWYATSDEAFYTDMEVELDPKTQEHFCISTGSKVEYLTEPTYNFKLSMFQDRLLQFYSDNPDFIVPKTRYNEIMTKVSKGLSDLSVSRPKSRVSWGIPVPSDPSQTIYVWLDALFNYLSVTKPSSSTHFPPDLQIIGKDILTFHTVYWPAFLMACNLPLPRQVLAHGHWTVDGKKMSKSLRNGVDPNQLVDTFGIDAVRYYLLANGSSYEDNDFSQTTLMVKWDKELASMLGNLVQRVTSLKLNPNQQVQVCEIDTYFQRRLKASLSNYQQAFQNLAPNKATIIVNELLAEANKYLQDAQPWKLDLESAVRKQVLFTVFETLRFAAIMLLPIIPTKANQVLDRINVPTDRRLLKHLNSFENGWDDQAKKVDLKFESQIIFPKLS